MAIDEMVVLMSNQGEPIGLAPKADVHTADTPLHLAFSCYIMSNDGRILLTRRALGKRTWAGVWTNSVCGHPASGEVLEDAVRRRAMQELNAEVSDVHLILSDFRYLARDAGGIVENEVCPVFVARMDDDPSPNADEVVEWNWIEPELLSQSLNTAPFVFSPWLREQFPLLSNAGAFARQHSAP